MKKRIYIIGIITLLLLSAVGGIAYTAYQAIMAPTVQGTQTIYIQIRPNDDALKVEKMLASAADIKSMKAFAPLMKHYKYDTRVKPGNYAIRPGDSMRDICLRLLSGNQTPVKLVIPSVRTLDRMAGAVGKQLMTDSASIAAILSDSHLIDSLGYTTETFPTMFIPNTYEVYWTMTPQQFIARIHKEHTRFWNDKRLSQAKALGLTPVEVATLASIVEEETNKNDEKPLVAGLYLNRLKRGMLLQADPTVKYAHGKFELRRILLTHLNIDSPYNTYKYAGLPAGPISNPGLNSITAALNPSDTSYYYYALDESTGFHHFSKTAAEHENFLRD